MLSLAKGAGREPIADIKAAERWLASFVRDDPVTAHAEIVRQVRALAQDGPRRVPLELEALFHVDSNVEHVRRGLVTQYLEHAGHSSEVERKLWHAMLDLAQAFETAYAAYVREIRRRPQDTRWQAHLPEVLARYVDHLAFDARVRMFRYEPWIPGKWRELHDVFTLACAEKIRRQPVTLAPAREPTTIERKYVALLVLQLANAGNLKPYHVEWLWRQMESWCVPLKLRVTTRSPTALYVDLRETRGLSRRSGAGSAGEVLFLDTQPLTALLRHYIMAVEQKIRSHPLSGNTPRRVERLAVLGKITAQVEGQFAPVPRRGERASASGEVDVVLGLDNICAYLREPSRIPVSELDTVSSFSGTLELAIFGRLRVGDQRAETARRRLERYAAPGGPWEAKDVSATGFRLLAPIAAAHSVTLGTIAALRGTGETVWKLGIVRRIRRLTADRAEIGVQRVADTVSTIEIVAEPATAPDDATADPVKRKFEALFLALDARGRSGAVQSLLLPRLTGEGVRGLRLSTESTPTAIRVGRTIEEQPEWLWVAVEPTAAPPRRAAA